VTDPTADPSPEHVFGDVVVIIDHKTTHRPYASTEFNFRIKRLGVTYAYRVEISDEEIAKFEDRRLAEYLLRHARHRSLLYPPYREKP